MDRGDVMFQTDEHDPAQPPEALQPESSGSDEPSPEESNSDEPSPEEPTATHVVETARRLSESGLWALQHRFYDGAGVGAWASGTVPWFITSNAAIARAYARILDAFLRDVADGAFGPFDTRRPVHFVELGAGHGRFGFLLVERLRALQARGEIPPFRYVMTDFAEANIRSWLDHPRLQPHFAAGVLDVARFDASSDTQLELRVSKTVLAPGQDNGPVAIIANYILDSLLHDVFSVRRGVLYESRPAIYSTRADEDLDDPGCLKRLELVYEHSLAEAEPYGDAELDGILGRYAAMLDDTAITFPAGPIRAIRRLDALSGGRTFLLSGDKGYIYAEDLARRDEPQLVVHGSFSFSVNYHAIAEWFRGRGGAVFASTPRDGSFTINAFATGASKPALRLTCDAFDDAIEQFGPMDFMPLEQDYRADAQTGVQASLALLRLGDFDPWLFHSVSAGILAHIDSAAYAGCRDVRRAIQRVWQNYFHLAGSTSDVPFEIARVLTRLESYAEALRFYEISVSLFGDSHVTRHNMGLCHFWCHRFEDALACFETALAMQSDYAPSRSWRLKALGELRP